MKRIMDEMTDSLADASTGSSPVCLADTGGMII